MIQKPSILIVDDEPVIRRLLKDYLGENYECCAAGNVTEAAGFLARRHFDLAIVDVLMPGQSGLELCEMIQKSYPQTRSIVLSAVAEVSYVIEATRRGALSFARKPCDLPYLSRLIDIALKHRLDSAAPKSNSIDQTNASLN